METEVTVYGPIRSATGDKTVILEWSGGTVADALAALVDAYPRAESQLYDGDAVRSRATESGSRTGFRKARLWLSFPPYRAAPSSRVGSESGQHLF